MNCNDDIIGNIVRIEYILWILLIPFRTVVIILIHYTGKSNNKTSTGTPAKESGYFPFFYKCCDDIAFTIANDMEIWYFFPHINNNTICNHTSIIENGNNITLIIMKKMITDAETSSRFWW